MLFKLRNCRKHNHKLRKAERRHDVKHIKVKIESSRSRNVEGNLVVCFDKNAVAFHRGQTELLGNVVDEVLDPGACRYLKYLKRDQKRLSYSWKVSCPVWDYKNTQGACSHLLCVVWEVDFVEDLGAVQLDGIHLHLMWWQLSGLHPTQTKQMLFYIFILALSPNNTFGPVTSQRMLMSCIFRRGHANADCGHCDISFSNTTCIVMAA